MLRNILRAILIVLVLINIGCVVVPPQSVMFTCNIDGEEFKAVSGGWGTADNLGIIMGYIQVADSNKNIFTFNVLPEFEVKTYALGSYDANAYYHTGFTEGYDSQSGFLTITSKTNDRLRGEFEMTLVGGPAFEEEITLEVTDGKFNLPHGYPTQ